MLYKPNKYYYNIYTIKDINTKDINTKDINTKDRKIGNKWNLILNQVLSFGGIKYMLMECLSEAIRGGKA